MPSEEAEQKVLVKYLLGDLPETEQVEVEDRAFADAEYLTALEAAEADLIDAWMRGELSSSEQRAFERRFLTSPGRRSKVEFARAFARVLTESKRADRLVPRITLRSLIQAWSPGWRLAAGLAALLIIGWPVWLLTQNSAMRSRVAVLETQRQELEKAQQGLRRQLDEQGRRDVNAAAQRQSAATPLIASLVLLPGLSRAETRTEQLILSPTAQIARIEIQLEARDDYPRFRAELRTRSGAEVLTVDNLRPQRSAGANAVSFHAPASLLEAGEYELSLKGRPRDGVPVDVGYYYFSVRK